MDYRLICLEANMMEKYGLIKLPEDIERENIAYIKSIIDPRLLQRTDLQLVNIDGNKICNSFKRIVLCGYGAYVELNQSMLLSDIVCDEERYKHLRHNDDKFLQKPYVNYTIDDGWHMRIRLCTHWVNYGDFIPGAFYINAGEVWLQDKYEEPFTWLTRLGA